MKNLILLLTCLGFLSIESFGQLKAGIYEHENLAAIVESHQTVAILPFEYTLTYKKLPKGMTDADVKAQEESSAKSLQNSMHTWLLRKSDNYTVSFQDPRRTNAMLLKEGIEPSTLLAYTMDEICTILEVDAVISGFISTNKPMNTGGAVAMTIFTGFSGKTNQSDGYISFYDGASGDLFFKYAKEVGGSIGSSADDTIDRIMKKLSKKFPYKKI